MMANPFDQFDGPAAAPAAAAAPATAPAVSSTPADFAATYGGAASRAGEKLGVDPGVLLGQWGHETGWGKSVVPGTNNLGNIKDVSGAGVPATDNMTGSRDKYQQFATPEDFADHYADLIQRKYPGAVGAGADSGKFASALASGGYAEDPNYASRVQAATKTVSPFVRAANAVADAVIPSAQAAPVGKPAANPFDQFDSQPKAASAKAAPMDLNPTSGNSFLQNLAIGAGKAVTDLGQGAGQRLRSAVEAVDGKQVADNLGLPTSADVAEKRRIDAPVMKTAGGKTGAFAATAVPAAAAAFVPGGQGLAGSMIAGGILGGLEPTTDDESALTNTFKGAVSGGAGYGVGQGIGILANSATSAAAKAAAANAPRDAIAASARDMGLSVPPSQTNPGILNGALEGFSGKIATGQKSSINNQPTINSRVAVDLGLAADQPISRATLNSLRNDAAQQGYAPVRGAGQITPTPAYDAALDQIVAPYVNAAKGFPNAAPSPIINTIEGLRSPSFDASSAVDMTRSLRDQASSAFASGDKVTGKSLAAASKALEDAIETHLSGLGQPGADMLNNFRSARAQIAKSYSVEKALNDATGNVNAVNLGQQLKKGAPLTGDLKTIAQVGQAFPTAVKEVTSSMPGVSPLDFFSAAHIIPALGHGILGAMTGGASLAARPLVRAGILSKPYQGIMGVPSYGGSTTLNALASEPGQLAIRGAGTAGLLGASP